MHHQQVAVGNGLKQQAAQAGQVKHVFHHDGPGQQVGKLQPQQRQNRPHGIAQHMAPEDLVAAQPFGAGGAHKVCAHMLQHRRARQPRQNGRLHARQRQRGQDQRLQGGQQAAARILRPARKTTGADPLQAHGEHHNQQHGQPKAGNGQAQLGAAHEQLVRPAALVGGGVQPHGQGQQAAYAQGQQGQRHGQLQALQQQIGHGLAIGVAVPQITVQQAAQPAGKARPGGGVQAQLGGQGGHGLRVGIGPEQHLGGIARQQVQHGKDQGRRSQQGQQQRQ